MARCAGEDRFYKFLHILFSQQSNWAFQRSFQQILTNIGQLGGVSPEEYARCISDTDVTNIILANRRDAELELKINATPAIYINGKRFENHYNYELLSQKINELLDKG